MQSVRVPYISLLNFGLFAVFCGCLWLLAIGPVSFSGHGVGRVELETLVLQVVSMLLLLGSVQMPYKSHRVWRWVLLALSFVALGQSVLIALLSPVA